MQNMQLHLPVAAHSRDFPLDLFLYEAEVPLLSASSLHLNLGVGCSTHYRSGRVSSSVEREMTRDESPK